MNYSTRTRAHTTSVKTLLVRLLATLAAVLATCLLTLAPAYSQDPFDLPDELVDEAGALTDESAVRAAQDALYDGSGLQLFVVFVDDFGDLSGADWADETAQESNLGDQDLLVAVATQERSWGMSVSDDSGISAGQQDRVAADYIEPALRESDWDGAAIGAADGFLAMSQEESTTGRNVLIGLGGLAGVTALGFGGRAVKRRRDERAVLANELAERQAQSEAIGGQLVDLDNALAASENELQYAEAEFTTELTGPFRLALEESREESVKAYRLRQGIGEVDQESISHTRTMEAFAEIQKVITTADARLDEHTEAFNDLRQLAARAPERIKELGAALLAAKTTLDDTEPILATRGDLRAGQRDQLSDIIASCRALLAQGAASLELAGQRVASGGGEDAVLPLKAAEAALSEISAQTEQLGNVDELVAGWEKLLQEASTSLTQDVADAERLAADDGAVMSLVATARAGLARVQDPAQDPVDLAEELGDVERALDAALTGVREQEEKHLKAVKTAQAQLSRATARVGSMEDNIRRHRTFLTEMSRRNAQEARDLLAQGTSQLESDPAAADEPLRLAASRALSVSHSLQDRAAPPEEDSGSGWGWGGSSSGSSRRRSSFSSSRSSSRRSSSRSSSRRSSSRRSSSRRSSGGRF